MLLVEGVTEGGSTSDEVCVQLSDVAGVIVRRVLNSVCSNPRIRALSPSSSAAQPPEDLRLETKEFQLAAFAALVARGILREAAHLSSDHAIMEEEVETEQQEGSATAPSLALVSILSKAQAKAEADFEQQGQ